jgi:hypothetical protein
LTLFIPATNCDASASFGTMLAPEAPRGLERELFAKIATAALGGKRPVRYSAEGVESGR